MIFAAILALSIGVLMGVMWAITRALDWVWFNYTSPKLIEHLERKRWGRAVGVGKMTHQEWLSIKDHMP